MTVKELIERLSKFDDDKEVYINTESEFLIQDIHDDYAYDDFVWIEAWYK